MRTQTRGISRRTFLAQGTMGAVGAALTPSWQRVGDPKQGGPLRVALVGTGSRGTSMWGKQLVASYAAEVTLVGLCDANLLRAAVSRQMIGVEAPLYQARDFDRMVAETTPDLVIVTTTDAFHADYIVRAMELGCDVLSEKPLATDAQQCQRILEAEAQTGQTVLVGFNARYFRVAEEIKKILREGTLGRIISAEFAEYLDVYHGASYFRRWHGKARYSGTLLVHKACHHFDQMNWWLEADPREVHAFGRLAFYGSRNPFRSDTCRGCAFQASCDFYWDITRSERDMELYVACEAEDGYLRDGCVWDNAIDTYDTMTVEVRYDNDVLLSYSLNAFMPYEGQRIAFNGEQGRLDVRIYYRQPWEIGYEADLRLTENFKASKTWRVGGTAEVDTGTDGHGGADGKLKNMIFLPDQFDPLGQRAGSRAGVMASLIGIAARHSIETGQRVDLHDLIDFPLTWGWR